MSDLFDFANPVTHSGDPDSSRRAAERITRDGSRARHARLVLDLVQRMPGSTAVELWHNATNADRDELEEMQEIRRRLTDLQSAGLVRQTGIRACLVRGSKMATWAAT